MHASSVILLTLFTSIIASAGTVYVIERTGVFSPHAAVAETQVPDFRGVSESDARANATALHISLLIAGREPSADAKAGTVIRQSAPAGQRVPHDYSISVVLAEEQPRVPAVTGLTVAAATERLTQRGFAVSSSVTPSADVPPGMVVEQSPKGETAAPKGATVTLRISGGPEEVEVPKVAGLALAKAQTALEKVGLKPVVRWVALAETATYVVLSQKPAAGAKAKPGDEIELTACR